VNEIGAAPAVQTSELVKTYRQGDVEVRALNSVSLRIEAGEFAVLAGPSGSGKTTLLNLIGALDRPSSGQVAIGGNDLSAMSVAELACMRREHIGFVFQAYNLLPVLSAVENAELVLKLQGVPRAECRARAGDVLRAVGLGQMLGRRPSELSGGQQQRVAVARAIVSARTLILADEPTANLDTKAAESLLDIMVELNASAGTTFLFSTHDPRVVARARRVIHLEDGRLVRDERAPS
jgi:putative ABC transport system ATP-binding protein